MTCLYDVLICSTCYLALHRVLLSSEAVHVSNPHGSKSGNNVNVSFCSAGAAQEGAAGANEAAQQKALPPWMLRQGITSTSASSSAQHSGAQHSGTSLMQASSAAVAAGSGANGSEVSSAEEDRKRIEVLLESSWLPWSRNFCLQAS